MSDIKEKKIEEKVEQIDDENVNYEEKVETLRVKVLGTYKHARKVSNILMLIVAAIVVAGFILAVQKETLWMVILGWCLVGGALVFLIIHYFLTKDKMPKAIREYIATVSTTLNKEVLSNEVYTKITSDKDEKFQLADIISDQVYTLSNQIASRNIVKGQYNFHDFTVGELALYSPGKSRQTRNTDFVGKYIVMKNKLNLHGRYVFTFKGEKDYDLPTGVDDLNNIGPTDDKHIYRGPRDDLKDVFPAKFLKALKAIEPKDALYAVNIAIWGGHSAVYLSYDDSLITLPFEKSLNVDAVQQYKQNLNDVLAALCLID